MIQNRKYLPGRLLFSLFKQSNRNALVFAFFVFLSSAFWFIKAINKNYIDTVSFPVSFENFPPNRVQIKELPKEINLTVETTGFIILKYKIRSAISPININIADCSIFPFTRKDTSKFYILTNLERNQISSNLSSEIKMLEISPDTVIFHFDVVILKKFPIKPDISITCAKQYMQVNKPVLIPDSIELNGPKSILDTMSFLSTRYYSFDDVTEPIEKNISIEKIPGIDTERRKIKLLADIDKSTQTGVKLNIIPKNVPDTLQLKTFPKNVDISYLVPLKLYEKIKPADFLVTVDFNDIDKLIGEKLKVNIEKYPDNIKLLGIEPRNVEFIIEK